MAQANVTVYLSRTCFYCTMVQRLLNTKGIKFQSIVVDGHADLWQEMKERSGGGSTVPQVFIDGRPVGGYTDLLALDREGMLDDLLFPTRCPDTPMKEISHE
ncbi:MAG: glutaredoxin 3 [Gammaproteobacteria bacterium]|nr:glutaredoxin 3 [Gammaproteobacteria bacterium]